MHSINSILSAGIDVGTTSTHFTLSRLQLGNTSVANQAPRIAIYQREILHRSAIHLTPVLSDRRIDADGVAALIRQDYADAGICAEQVQTGAVIITGETARLRNAEAVVHSLANLAGDFVVASAGAHLESILAARGSGAAVASAQRQRTICNIDIGGGTTNYAVFSNGQVIDSACIAIGGRCMQFNESGQLLSLTDSGELFLDAVAKNIPIGSAPDINQLRHLGNLIAESLVQFIVAPKLPQVSQRLLSTEPLRRNYHIDEYWFSGGVAELMKAPDSKPFAFGDMGVLIAQGLVGSMQERNIAFHIPEDAIRATVIGAGMHSLQLSGSTIAVHQSLLPLKNVPLLRPFSTASAAGDRLGEFVLSSLKDCLERSDIDWSHVPTAILIENIDDLSFPNVERWAKALAAAFTELNGCQPLIIVTAQDISMALGQMLKVLLPNSQLVSIDGISSGYGDYIDIGKPLPHHQALPVVLKDLVFST
jgi:ethanolamine utilization protein EutA